MNVLSQRLERSRSRGELARLEREFSTDQALPSVVAVLPLDRQASTTPVTAAVALFLDVVAPYAVAAVDSDGTAQPLRYLLDSTGAGDLVGLAASHDASLRRRRVEDFVDMGARVPLASCWPEGPGEIPPVILRDAVWKLRRRFPGVVIDVPRDVPAPTIAAATNLASHVILVGDRNDVSHAWLHSGDSLVSRLAKQDHVTVVAMGGDHSARLRCDHDDIVPMAPPAEFRRAQRVGLDIGDIPSLAGLAEVARRLLR